MVNVHEMFKREVCAARDQIAGIIREQDRVWRDIRASSEQWRQATAVVCSRLPLRGWYLSGQEPAPLIVRLARHIEANAWADVDRLMLNLIPVFKSDSIAQWLGSKGVAAYSVGRLRRFIDHHQAGNYEEATYLGVPLLDEICLQLYGTEFTRKAPKETLITSASAKATLSSLGRQFANDFGSLQDTIVPARLHDEDYWCRHAILHGKMRRPMGIKDSAKCCMAMAFLIRNRHAPE